MASKQYPFLPHFAGHEPSIMGVVGTLGTSDTGGTANILPISVDPTTGALYVNIAGGTIAGMSTSAKQDTIIGHVDGIETTLNTIEGVLDATLEQTSIIGGAVSGSEMQVDIVSGTITRVSTIGTLELGTVVINSGTFTPTGFSYNRQTASGTTTVKSGAGVLHTFVINAKSVGGAGTLFDNTAASGTVIAVIDTTPSTTSFLYDTAFTNGLTFAWAGNTGGDITMTYR